MLKFLFKNYISRKMLVNFRELTSNLMSEAGMEEVMPDKAEKKAPMAVIVFFIILFILGRTGIFWEPVKLMIGKATDGGVLFFILPIVFMYLMFGVGFFLYQVWVQKLMKTELVALIPFAERAVIALKAAGREDIKDEITDAEYLISEYKSQYGM